MPVASSWQVFSQHAAGGEPALRALGAAYGYTNCFTHILKDYCSQQDSESDPEANLGVCTEYDMTGSDKYETISAHLQSMMEGHNTVTPVGGSFLLVLHLMSRLRYALNVGIVTCTASPCG
jgi:hypothetical protein